MHTRNVYNPVQICLRMLVILGLLGVPSTSWGQEVTTTSQTEQSNAQLYQDAKFDFMVQVPPEWTIYPSSMMHPGGTTIISSYGSNTSFKPHYVPRDEIKIEIGVVKTDGLSNKNLNTWVKQNQLENSKVLAEQDIQFDSLPAVRLDVEALDGTQARLWYVTDDNVVYFIIAMPLNSVYMKLAEQMVRTLQVSDTPRLLTNSLDAIADDFVNNNDIMATHTALGYRLPFNGTEIITNGPKCSTTHGLSSIYSRSSEAIDYALKFEDVRSTEEGDVITSQDGWNGGFGSYIKIRHDNGNISYYAHLSSRMVNEGDKNIPRGTRIGISGKSGNVTGPHLHFEVRDNTNQSIWMRDLPNTTWYTGDINQPCMPSGQNDGTATHAGDSGTPICPAPALLKPDRRFFTEKGVVEFDWASLDNCAPEGYTIRIRTNSNMDLNGSGETVLDTGVGQSDYRFSIESKWFGKDLFWSVKAANGSHWANPRLLHIQENKSPTIDFKTANGNGASTIITREQNWTFTGTASDPENQLRRIEFKCDGDNCGNGDSQSTSGNWTIRRDGMSGKNIVYFRAYDEKQHSESRKVTLIIDRAAPTSKVSLNNDQTPINGWYNTPVAVGIDATDQATGNARANVKEIRYRLDNGSEQVVSGSSASFTVNSDGNHTVRYYAIDKAGNQEAEKSITFKLDATPPSAPSGIMTTNGAPNNQWQKSHNALAVTWAAASDAHSGVAGYEIEWMGSKRPNQGPNERSFQSDPVRTGTHTLRGRTRDQAGNFSNWVDMFTLRYDNTAPENPKEATHTGGIQNDIWQRTTNQADFTWPVPHDEGSGIKGYQLYWGTDPDGTATTLQTGATFQSTVPVCNAGETCTGYLRIRSVDNVENQAEGWSTAFALRFDDTPPVLDLSFPGSVTQTAQSLITLQLDASDTGSGVKAMRFSHDGNTWTPWEAYAPQRLWEIPAIGRQSWPVYAQVQDGVGLISQDVRREIYFEVNRPQPQSANYRLFDTTMSAGAGVHTSGSYKGQSTVGQVVDSAHIASTQYQLTGGYQAGSQAIPLVIPGHDEFLYINSVFASGIVAQTMQSPSYQMIGTLGETGLPNNVTTLTSNGYQHQPGFLAAVPALAGTAPLPTPQPGPEPEPEPEPDCEFPTISINQGATFTGVTNVALSLCAPYAVEMKVSNDGGFTDSPWEPYSRAKAWTITTHGETILPRWVYAAFKDANGVVYATYLDDIIYDPNAPEGNLVVGDPWAQQQAQAIFAEQVQAADATAVGQAIRIGEQFFLPRVIDTGQALLSLKGLNAEDAVELYLFARDDNSGIVEMQIDDTADLTNAPWEPYSFTTAWVPTSGDGEKTLYARFRDTAGNISDVVENAFVLDSTAPTGDLLITPGVVGGEALTITLSLPANDTLSGVTDMRIGTSADLTTADWQPYTTEIVWPIYLTAADQEGTIYVQYRDAAGNISAVYSDYYLVDRMPPVVYVEVQPGETLTRQVDVLAYDELSYLETMSISNDPLMVDGVVTQPYTDTITWEFDDRQVVWIQIVDSNGNVGEPYPAYAADADESSPTIPTLTLAGNSTIGAPGSQFELTGANLPVNAQLTLSSNGLVLGTVQTDENGAFNVVITTHNVSPGQYRIIVDGTNAGVTLTIDATATLQTTDSTATQLALPTDNPSKVQIFLPIIAK